LRVSDDVFVSNMTERLTRTDAVFAALAGIAGFAGSYATAGYSRSFLMQPIDDFVVNVTPGAISQWMIENVGAESHHLHHALSICIAVTLLGLVAVGGITVARRLDRRVLGSLLAGFVSWGLVALLTGAPVLALGAAVPVLIFTAVGAAPAPAAPDYQRRRVVAASAGALGFVGLGFVTGNTFAGPSLDTGDAVPGATKADVDQRFQEARERELDLASTELPGLVSTIDNFFRTSISSFDPAVEKAEWTLSVTGEVGTDAELTYDELTQMPVEHRLITLRCVGENLNGKKLDTAVWTGTPIRSLLDEVDPEGACGCVMIHGEDGYYVQFPVEALEDGFLAWGMNGQPLPRKNGHPVRVLVPGHWGETNVKWIQEIELLEEAEDGYWEERGWEGTGPVNTVAKLWDEGITRLDDGRVELAGHAYAGTRGIDRVEVSTDAGETWAEAELSEPLPDEDVWRQYRYEFEPDGMHEVMVRAVDGEGSVQTEEKSSPAPSGATGWVHKTVTE
jgi:DMSO/TMAO reductase YedYZ molybdopterin-dependent catalytic subunit